MHDGMGFSGPAASWAAGKKARPPMQRPYQVDTYAAGDGATEAASPMRKGPYFKALPNFTVKTFPLTMQHPRACI
ncbi:hypothetical protein BCAR13_300137 [Paraburkholderia caribensis]|nr:hypothetical protein BCAR13_300137 [Paraburkholderia caribensis]